MDTFLIMVGLFTIIISGCLEASQQSPILLNSSITKIKVHEGLDGGSFCGDFIIIDIYLKDGRRYGIAQIFKGPIYIVGHQKDFDFFLEKDSIAFQSPLLDIAVKNFDLSPEIQ